MNILNFFNSRTAKNASQFNGLNYANRNQVITASNVNSVREYLGYLDNGKYDNYYADINRIIQEAPNHKFYYVVDDNTVDVGNVAEVLLAPNDDYGQYKFLQQVYTEILTRGKVDLKFWHLENGKETFYINGNQNESNFSGITIVSEEDRSRDNRLDRGHYITITYGANQSNVFLGYSPTQAAENWRKMIDAMGLHMTAFAKNAGMPLGKFIITAPSVEDFRKIKKNLDVNIAGNKNNGKIIYDYKPSEASSSQIEWVQFTSDKAQDYSSSLEFAERQKSQMFGVPGIIKGTGEDANYATARVSEYIFVRYTITGLVRDVLAQFNHILRTKFAIAGEIKADVELPELADETLVKVQATREQLDLYERKVAEGYDPRSIITALNLPERFLLLEKVKDPDLTLEAEERAPEQNKARNLVKNEPVSVSDTVSEEYMQGLEADYRSYALEYAEQLAINEAEAQRVFINAMTARFDEARGYLYSEAVSTMSVSLLDSFETVDLEQFNLSDAERELALKKYRERVELFAENFKASVLEFDGDSVEFKQRAEANAERIAITEAEHVKIISQLDAWEKASEELPIRVFKRWKARPTACDVCRELHDMEVDVSVSFKENEGVDAEFSEVKAGSAHPRCHCTVYYEYERTDK